MTFWLPFRSQCYIFWLTLSITRPLRKSEIRILQEELIPDTSNLFDNAQLFSTSLFRPFCVVSGSILIDGGV